MTSRLRQTGLVVGGVLLGVAGAAGYSVKFGAHPSDIVPAVTVPEAPANAPLTMPVAFPRQDTALASVEARLSLLETRAGHADAMAPPARHVPGPAELEKAHEQRHENLVANHKRAPVDATWAPSAERRLSTGLGKLAARDGFTVRGVNCRTTTCTADIEWSSYGAAQKTFRSILVEERTELNCKAEVFIPMPSNLEAPYRSTAMYDCEESMSEGNR